MLTYFQAIVMGLLQGFSELFPISSLGHSVILPALLGWDSLVRAQSASESFFLAFLVGLHVATALALLWYFREDWVRIIRAWFRSLAHRSIQTPDERLAWLLVVATIPAGITGIAFERLLRIVFAKPFAAAVFLTLNGVILFAGERYRKRAEVRELAVAHGSPPDRPFRSLETMEFREAAIIGVAQVLALFAGISRSGITMVAGLVRGLSHEDAARFSFLLATPIILAAGVYKLPDLMGSLGNGVRLQILVGSICAAIMAYLSIRFLMRYFETRTLNPFAIYCLLAGVAMIVRFGIF
jgi:undecaprenyl-diphosphatase